MSPCQRSCTKESDPGHSVSQIIQQAGQVWLPDSAYKTAQAIKDFNRERLPLMIFANWRGFSGGMKGKPAGCLSSRCSESVGSAPRSGKPPQVVLTFYSLWLHRPLRLPTALRTGAVQVKSSHFTDEELRVPGVTCQRSHCEGQGREGSPGNFPSCEGAESKTNPRGPR